jgi:NAD(P)-dependent dehydrogenase (short-subunit alcohol dehydrogenase family)
VQSFDKLLIQKLVGIGFNFSEIAFSKGNHVIIADLRLTPVAEEFVKKNEATKRVVFVECDVTLWKDLQNLVTVSLREFEDVPDAYVAAAGLFETVSFMTWKVIFRSYSYSVITVTILFLRRQRGRALSSHGCKCVPPY